VNCVAWNSADTHVASASLSIQLHSLVSGVAVASLKHKGTDAVKVIQFSPHKKHLLAAACGSGIVCVWDTNLRTLGAVYYGAHTSQVSSVSFSPANHLLLCSVGLDQRISFFDSAMQRSVKTIEANAPLTSLAFHRDGANLAVGTLSGAILLYDLRFGSVPKAALEGHEGSAVNWLEFSRSKVKTKPDKPAAPPVQKFRTIEEIREEAKARIERKKAEALPADPPPTRVSEDSYKSSGSIPEHRFELKQARRVVQDAVMKYDASLRDDVSGLHVELVRQLTQQSVSTTQAEVQLKLEEAAAEQTELLIRLKSLQREAEGLTRSL
jgi:hypothetical protein